jgi:hypothetical protein
MWQKITRWRNDELNSSFRSTCKEINDSRIVFEYLKSLFVKDIFSTINLRIFTDLSLYNNFTLSHIHSSLYLICRTLRAHIKSSKFEKSCTWIWFSNKLYLNFRFSKNLVNLHLQYRKTIVRSRSRRSSRQLIVNRLSLDSSCLDYSITTKIINDNQSSSTRDFFF